MTPLDLVALPCDFDHKRNQAICYLTPVDPGLCNLVHEKKRGIWNFTAWYRVEFHDPPKHFPPAAPSLHACLGCNDQSTKPKRNLGTRRKSFPIGERQGLSKKKVSIYFIERKEKKLCICISSRGIRNGKSKRDHLLSSPFSPPPF